MTLLAISRLLFWLGCLLVCQLTFRPFEVSTISDLFFGVALSVAVANAFICRRLPKPPIPPIYSVGIALIFFGGIISSPGAQQPIQSLSIVLRFIGSTAALFFLAIIILREPRHILYAAIGCVISAAANGAAAIAQVTVAQDIIPGTSAIFGRATGFTQHFNDLGASCACCAPAAIELLTRSFSRGWALPFAVCCLAMIIAGILLSGSLASILALAVGMAVWLTMRRFSIRAVAWLMLACIVVSITGLLLVEHGEWTFDRSMERVIAGAPGTSGGTLATRLESIDAALEQISTSPIIGVGLTERGAVNRSGFATHNVPIMLWYEAGFLAFLGGVLMIFGWLPLASTLKKRYWREIDRDLAACLIGGCAAFATFMMTTPGFLQRYGWIWFALLFSLSSLARRSRQSVLNEASPSTDKSDATDMAKPKSHRIR